MSFYGLDQTIKPTFPLSYWVFPKIAVQDQPGLFFFFIPELWGNGFPTFRIPKEFQFRSGQRPSPLPSGIPENYDGKDEREMLNYLKSN